MSSQPDPFARPVNITLTPASKVRVAFLLGIGTLEQLRKLRDRAGVRFEHSETWAGEMLAQLLDVADAHPDASPLQVLTLSKESPMMRSARHGLGSQLATSDEPLSARELAEKIGIGWSQHLLNSLNNLVQAGVAEGQILRKQSDRGAPPRRWRLTPKGVALTASDHPDEETRFILGGLIPEAETAEVKAQDPFFKAKIGELDRLSAQTLSREIARAAAPGIDAEPSALHLSGLAAQRAENGPTGEALIEEMVRAAKKFPPLPVTPASLMDPPFLPVKVAIDSPACTCPPLSGYERPELTGHEPGCPAWCPYTGSDARAVPDRFQCLGCGTEIDKRGACAECAAYAATYNTGSETE